MNKYKAYSLGLLFADGHINKKLETISIEMKSEDLDLLIPQLTSLCNWNIYKRQRTRNGNLCNPTTVLNKGDKNLCKELSNIGYRPKIAKIALENIPSDLKYFWIRGFFDGDGCYYHHPKQYLYQISIAGDHDIDWSFLSITGIFFKTDKVKTGTHARLTNKNDVLKFMTYIYPNGYDFGIERKWNNFYNTLGYKYS